MTNNLLFDFTVDKTTKTVLVTREFNAGLSLVWDAFTKAEILDQWWAPKPCESRTKSMDFKVGGRRFYAMVCGGPEMWAVQDFTSISPKTNFKFMNAFADENGNIKESPGSEWDLNFSEQNGTTKVIITIRNESLERLQKMVEMGFKEGFTSALNNLHELLSTSL